MKRILLSLTLAAPLAANAQQPATNPSGPVPEVSVRPAAPCPHCQQCQQPSRLSAMRATRSTPAPPARSTGARAGAVVGAVVGEATKPGTGAVAPAPATPTPQNAAEATASRASSSKHRPRRVVLPPSTPTPRGTSSSLTKPPRVVPSRSSRPPAPLAATAQRPGPATRTSSPPPTKHGLGKNITIHLAGDIQGVFPIDLQLTGSGPNFTSSANFPSEEEGSPAAIANIEFDVTDAGKQYYVTYTISARVPAMTNTTTLPNGKQHKNFEFHSLTLHGAVHIAEGECVTLSRLNNKNLTVSIPAQDSN